MSFLRRIFGLAVLTSTLGLLAGCGGSSSSGTPVPTPAPAVTLSTVSLAFPNTPVTTTSSLLSVTVTNSGTANLTFTSVTISGTNASAFSITQNNCTTVAPAGSCTLQVTFTPPSSGGDAAAINLVDNAGNSPQTVALSGTGTAPAVSLSATTLAFPNTNAGTTSAGMNTTLTNSGSATLTISSVTISGSGASAFAVSANTCGSSVAASANCAITVTFTPPATQVTYTASLNITDNASGSPQTVTLTGTGAGPGISFSPSPLAAGQILPGSTAPMTLTISNPGTGSLSITGTSISGTNASSFSVTSSTCPTPPATVAAGGSCQMSLTFSPATVGNYTATLNVSDNVAGSPQPEQLTGSAVAEPNSCKSTNTTSPPQTPPTPNYAGTAFSGKVMAGSLPVIGASVQIFAAGTTGNGSTPTLLSTQITSAAGTFSVPASFTCPYNNSVLYAISSGGKAGASGNLNTGIVLAAVLGTCNSLTGSQTFTINEVTTAATAWSMAQFLAPGGKIGATTTNSSGANNSSGIVLAAGTFANLVNVLTGTSPGTYFPANGIAPTARINQLANLLNTCTASTGAASTACTQLYANTTTAAFTPATTLDAAMNLVDNPGSNVNALYMLSTGSTAFSPGMASAPLDWTLFINFTGGAMHGPSAISVDSTGRVWVANYFSIASLFTNTGSPVFPAGITGNNLQNSYGGNVDVDDAMWIANEQSSGSINSGLGSVTLLNSTGASPSTYTAGGLNFPIAIEFDTSGLSWVVDYGNSHLSILNNAGVPQSGTAGYTSMQYVFPVAVALDSKCNAYLANQSSNTVTFTSADGATFGSFVVGNGPSGVAVDASNNVWSANYYDNSIGLISSAGIVASGSGFRGGGVNHPQGIAIDGKGVVWVANYRATSGQNSVLSEFAGAAATSPGAAISPVMGWGGDAAMTEPFALAIDASGNIWISNFGSNSLTEFVGFAAPVKTPLLGPVRVP